MRVEEFLFPHMRKTVGLGGFFSCEEEGTVPVTFRSFAERELTLFVGNDAFPEMHSLTSV